MYKAKACSAASATSPLARTTIQRRDPTGHDVQIEILFCGICHSDLHSVRNEWSEFMPQEMLDFCGAHNLTADVEAIPIQKVNEAYERLLKSDVKYRFSIEMASLKSE